MMFFFTLYIIMISSCSSVHLFAVLDKIPLNFSSYCGYYLFFLQRKKKSRGYTRKKKIKDEVLMKLKLDMKRKS